MNNLHIVTVATESRLYFPYLVESCKKNGINLTVLGYGEEWKGFSWRFKKMIELLKNIPSDDIVCFLDGYDILCVRNLNELVPEFLKIKKDTNCKIVIGSDQFYYTFCKYWAKFTYGDCDNKLLNGGNYMGLAKDLLGILEYTYKKYPDDNNDDQLLLTKYCVQNPKMFYIDTESKIFLVYMKPFTEVRDVVIIKNDNVYYNNNRPFFVHTPGGFLDKLIIDTGYNYNYDNNIQDEIYKKVFNFSIFNQFKNALHIIIPLLIVVLSILIYIIYILYINKTIIINKISKMVKLISYKINK